MTCHNSQWLSEMKLSGVIKCIILLTHVYVVHKMGTITIASLTKKKLSCYISHDILFPFTSWRFLFFFFFCQNVKTFTIYWHLLLIIFQMKGVWCLGRELKIFNLIYWWTMILNLSWAVNSNQYLRIVTLL